MKLRICKCNRPSNHISISGGEEVHRCCACHIAAGGTASDWHHGCMNAIGRGSEVVNWDASPDGLCSSLV